MAALIPPEVTVYGLLLAQAVTDPTGPLLQFGAVGILAALAILAVKVLFSQQVAAYQRERDRADRLEQELRQLNADVRNDVMPALTRSTEAVSEAMQLLQPLKDRR